MGKESQGFKGVTGTYGKHERGKASAEDTVVSKSDNDGGGEPETVSAASSIYQNAVRNRPGEAGASIKALQDR